ncbi:unnamed protein product [Caenorhabditis auriculariae]|uniref:Laminin-like protein epi-1 n=1 Tax=Caenorhabditis auriculariae TaxID=2777116 RepID=A0A8S1HSS5_9PELO|nr:unnamed protein product [Caenorhabditis auriculariae]
MRWLTSTSPWLPLLLVAAVAQAQVLTPSQITISHRKPIVATSTCGEINGQPINEVYCSLTGSTQYTPLTSYSYQEEDETHGMMMQELRNPREAFVQGGHGCGHCHANTINAHPAANMVDGNNSWWMSPPLSRGLQYNQVNITIDLEQEFHVAYVWIQMANSPRPGTWVLERSTDHGKTYQPWFHFAENSAECMRKFGMESLSPISDDDSVVCRTDMASLQPLENAEMVIRILEHRPSSLQFATSEALQNFTRATNVRLRLLGTRTLQGHLMDMNEWRDPTVTRRYFYAIKEIMIGGRCVCNGHAVTCDILDPRRPRALLCRCEHNTCGDMCERCCPGFEQKQWQPTTAHNNFTCEPCNCFGRSNECVYDAQIDRDHQSLDIHGNYEGGGKCLNCRFNTEGINCNKCVYGYFRPEGTFWNETQPCKPCDCDPDKHTGACAEGTGRCECQPRFEGENCDRCAKGYYDPPECRACDCQVNGTVGEACLPTDGQCPCKDGFGGTFCETCAPGFTNVTAGCVECVCDPTGSENSNCSAETGQCECKAAFSGLACDKCQNGYYGYPNCTFCNCDPMGTEGGMCDESGQCLCKEGFAGEKCDHCDIGFYGYPNCKPCGCDGAGTTSPECEPASGQCPCNGNFTGRTCDKCAAGFYDYPQCKACSCLIDGAKGQTCDNNGQCYCKGNFEGERCDRCKPNFYNFPICEECNCNPSGVTPDFAGCDKVAPGELCSCRKNVDGRICDQCKPGFWDLQYHHPDGCIDCDCNLNGTLSGLNTCGLKTGQCVCKKNAAGRRCDQCSEGFYNLQNYNQLGCEPCNCNIGGSLRSECDLKTGQCKCRPRVTGLACDRPIENHYFPSLWHHQYEAEDGYTEEQRPVRFAVDPAQFANFSWRGYAVFSPIQEKILLDVDVNKASVYRLLFRYVNPTSVPVTATIAVAPRFTQTNDVEQSTKVTFPPSSDPAFKEITVEGKPFVLNPGKWTVSIATKQRLYLDYIVILPAEYYEGQALRERAPPPCHSKSTKNATCIDLLYPPLTSAARADLEDGQDTFSYVNKDGTTTTLDMVPVEIVPQDINGPSAFVRADNDSRTVEAKIEVPADGEYVVLVEYVNMEESYRPVVVDIAQEGDVKLNGSVVIHHCPYATFCRELVTKNGGQMAYVPLKKGQAVVQLHVQPNHEFGLAAINLIPKADFSTDYLQLVPVCIRKNGRCVQQSYPPAPDSVRTEAESGSNEGKSIYGDKLPFPVARAKEVRVVPLDDSQGTIEISGVVPARGHYMFLVHYFNNDNTPLNVDVLLQNEHYFQASVHLSYCPSVIGCVALISDKERPETIQFWMDDKYTATLYHNSSQKGPIYIDSITAVSYNSFSNSLLKPLPLDLSAEFIKQCSEQFFQNHPENISDFCRDKIFALTTDFNAAAFSCDCVAQGSESFYCEEYGGQCKCKANVIGRRCERCAPGYYNFPECIKCQCTAGQQCDERTGQCFCPPHVEGSSCDRCVNNAYGYDPLIGCQKCDCHPQGSEGGNLVCDAESGQCLCRESVGGRQCDRCLAGFYAFPQCYACSCNRDGTTEEICDPTNAQCKCKENVYGARCEACKAGTFALSAENPLGCSNCYCFGVTDSCRSSMFPVSIMSVDMSAFITTDDSGIVDNQDDIVVYSSDTTSPASVYFTVPIEKNKDHTNSYGLLLTFKMSLKARSDVRRVMSSEPDVRISGGNRTVEFWAPEQPTNPEEEFTVKCRLVAENFLTTEGKPVTREDFMIILHSLTNITLKASYFEYPKSVSLHEFGLEVATENNQQSAVRAVSVEQCQCPAPYTGPSCQLCAQGYYRVDSPGNVLGACVPCDCNGHSGTCDPDTGICTNCEHNTLGDHCEICEEGHYGDATTGSPYACMPCSCPFAPSNNFATGCEVSEEGVLQQCHCKPGYAGDRCDRCDSGHFGQPTQIGGSCEPCNCNGNNNLTDSRACHPITGDCHLCEKNTAGRHCEWCNNWFWGDAVTAKNCTECACNQCGSSVCDNRSGGCECKPNVEGETCDRCKPDYFGFLKCRGCEPCHCGQAAFSTQCNSENGQCSCRPGAAGQRCEHCEHGYWNYGEHGCDKCDCEADLSMGTVCDVRTGQCHCQEGATGPRCDQCQPSYLRIPTMGCRRCDECVHHLIADVDDLGLRIDVLNTSIANISSATVVGARLARSRKDLNDHKELEKFLLNDDNEYENMMGDARSILTNRTAVMNLGNRTGTWANKTSRRSQNLTTDVEALFQDIIRRAEKARQAVQEVRDIAASIGSHSKAPILDATILQQAVETLHALEATSADPYPELATSAPLKIDAILNKTAVEVQRLQEQTENLATEQKKADNLADYLNSAQQLLKETQKKGDMAANKAKSISLTKLKSLVAAIGDEIEKIEFEKNDFRNKNSELRNETERTRDIMESIQNSMATLNETRLELTEDAESRRAKRTSVVDREAIVSRANDLSLQAAQIGQSFSGAMEESKSAVEAANAFKNISETMKSANEKAGVAVSTVEKLGEIEDLNGRIDKALNETAELLRRTSVYRQDAVNTLEKDAQEMKTTLARLKENVETMQRTRDSIKSGSKSPINETHFDDINAKVEQVHELKKSIEEALNAAKAEAEDVTKKADEVAERANSAMLGLKIARSNAKQLKELAPKVVESLAKLRENSASRSAKVESITDKVAQIKEMVAVARDAANKIKLGAHFERGSSLNLNLPPRVSRSAAHTDISFFFKTDQDHGIPVFFGNEESTGGSRAVPTDDFVAVEIEYGTPKVTVNLGDEPLVVKLDTRVSDGQWRQLNVERIGKTVKVSLTKPNSEGIAETKTGISGGNKSVLNLHHKISRLYVGGIPTESKISSEVRNRDFVGDIEGLKLHGEPIGLWNARENGVSRVDGAPKRTKAVGSEEASISLDGEGYTVYKPDHWNPRKITKISLSFLTFSPDGLLFFVGKDRDFMTLELAGGTVKLSADFGSGVGHWTVQKENYSDGKWHTVSVLREEKHVKIDVDGVVEEGDSPGDEAEMSVTEFLYVGGIPSSVAVRTPVIPLRGCIKSVRLGSDEVDLEQSHASKGARSMCPLRTVRTVSMLSERSTAVFHNVSSRAEQMTVTLKFKTRVPSGSILSVEVEDEEVLTLSLQDGILTASTDDDKVPLELAGAADEKWHYVSIRKTKTTLRIDADDLFTNEVTRTGNGDDDGPATIFFGRRQASQSFVGCVGDVTFNGELFDFTMANIKEVSLNGCSLLDEEQQVPVTTTQAPSENTELPVASDGVVLPQDEPSTTENPEDLTTEAPAEMKLQVISSTSSPSVRQPKNTDAISAARPDNACALPPIPVGEFAEPEGVNFGTQLYSRLEYEVVPESFDKSGTFTLMTRPTAFSGVFFFALSEKRTDHIGLMLDHGRVVFTFDAGSGQTVLKSNRSILDNTWHTIKASRRGQSAHLIVDDESVETIARGANDSVDTKAPFYVGGVPSELASFARTLVPGSRSQLSGCIRDFRINGKTLEGAKSHGTAQCSRFVEDGIFFGQKGGYAIVKKEFEVGHTFGVEFEIRARSPDGVLLSVGVMEYLTVQYLNGTIKLTVDSGSGGEDVDFTPTELNEFCDGHWHNIRVMKKKNLLTLTVNGRSKMRIMKKSSTDTATKDPLYLGGVPESVTNKGLETKKGFNGCIRFISLGLKPKDKRLRRKKDVDVATFDIFGDVHKHECPVN